MLEVRTAHIYSCSGVMFGKVQAGDWELDFTEEQRVIATEHP